MAAVSGLTGSITFASGYVLVARGWRSEIDVVQQDLTPLSPTGSHQQMASTGLLRGGRGSYSCRLAVPVAAAATGGPYGTNPEEWEFISRMTPRDVTPLGAEWRIHVAGLIESQARVTSYIDGTTILPVLAGTGTVVLTAATGISYSMPYVVENVAAGVDADDTERRIVAMLRAISAPTPAGVFTTAIAGVTGSAALIAVTGRQLSGTIFVTSVRVRVNRRTGEGGMDFEFVWSGEVTGA